MKQVILSLMLVINFFWSATTKARAESDPKTNQMIQGAGSLVGAAMSSVVGVEHISVCSWTTIPDCVMGILAFTAAATQLGISGYSFATAGKLSSEKGTNSKDIFGSDKPLPTDVDFNHLPDSSDPTFATRDAILKNMDKIQARIDDLKSQGILTDEILANPEKLLTPDQLDGFNAEKEKLLAGLEEGNGNSLEALLEGSESDGFQTASLTSQGGTFASGFDSLNLEGLLNLKEKGIQNSAPGYYGNVSLKSLRPESKMSLFERVSLKIKQETSRKPNAFGAVHGAAHARQI